MGNSRAVKLPESVAKQLEELKRVLGLKGMGEAARLVFDIAGSPLAILILAFEMRDDMKKLIAEMKELNKTLKELKELLSMVKS